MRIGIQKSVTNQYSIVDEDDENAPLVTFHNECNCASFVEKAYRATVDFFTNETLRKAGLPHKP